MTLNIDEIAIVGEPLILSTDEDVDDAESQLGISFPKGYREFVTTLGEGILGGCYIRVYPPKRILRGLNNVREWRERIDEYWFWDDGREVLPKSKALECFIIGDTMDGDELIFHPSRPDRIFVLPRHYEHIPFVDGGLFTTLHWLCASGELTEAFDEREFEPFDSSKEA